MSQHGRVGAAEAGWRSIFNHFTPSGPAAHQAEEVTWYFRVTPTSAGVIDKLWEASLCLREPVSFAEPISPVCPQSGQEDSVAWLRWRWARLPACSYIHQPGQSCRVITRDAGWMQGRWRQWSIWKCYCRGDLSGGSYFYLFKNWLLP